DKTVNTEQILVIWDKTGLGGIEEICDIKKQVMCKIISNQKTAFACKGLCANCRRNSATKDESPVRRIESVVNISVAGENNTALAVSIEFKPPFTRIANW